MAIPRASFMICVCSLSTLLVSTSALGQQDFDVWLNQQISDMVAARIAQTSNTNQVEIPSLGEESTALVDQSSASDFVGIGVNPIAISDDGRGEIERTTSALTINPYIVYAGLFSPRDPLRPGFYQERLAQILRKFSITVGTEELESDDPAIPDRRATILGLKFLSWNKRDVTPSERASVLDRLERATDKYASLRNAVIDSLFQWTREELGLHADSTFAFTRDLNQNLSRILGTIGPDQRRAIDRMIQQSIQHFEDLQRHSNDLATDVRKRLQVSLAVFSKTGDDLADEYRASVILDFGPEEILNVTLNGSFEFREALAVGEDDHYGGSVAGAVMVQLTGDNIFGTQPATFSVAGRWKKLDGIDAIFAVQGKLSVPLVNGVTLPVSLTYASDPDLVDEEEVRGQVGITIDTARLLKALQP